MSRRVFNTRKILVASVGIATASFVGCTTTTSGNLMLPPSDATSVDAVRNDASSGNLMVPPLDAPSGDATQQGPSDGAVDSSDAGASTGDAGDAGAASDSSVDDARDER